WGRADIEAIPLRVPSTWLRPQQARKHGRHVAADYDFDAYPNSWEGDDVPGRSVWLRVLGVVDSVLERLVEEPDGRVGAHVRPRRRQRQRCGVCGGRGPLYHQAQGPRPCPAFDLRFTPFSVQA